MIVRGQARRNRRGTLFNPRPAWARLSMNLVSVGRGSCRAAVPCDSTRLARRLALPGSWPPRMALAPRGLPMNRSFSRMPEDDRAWSDGVLVHGPSPDMTLHKRPRTAKHAKYANGRMLTWVRFGSFSLVWRVSRSRPPVSSPGPTPPRASSLAGAGARLIVRPRGEAVAGHNLPPSLADQRETLARCLEAMDRVAPLRSV